MGWGVGVKHSEVLFSLRALREDDYTSVCEPPCMRCTTYEMNEIKNI